MVEMFEADEIVRYNADKGQFEIGAKETDMAKRENNQRIAIIIKEEQNMEAFSQIQEVLSEEGYVAEICDGNKLNKESTYDAIIYEVKMDDMFYAIPCKKLKEMRLQNENLPIIAISNTDDPDAIAEILDAGADDVFSFPFAAILLTSKLGTLFRSYGMNKPEIGEYRLGNFGCDIARRFIFTETDDMEITRREASIMETIMRADGAVVECDAIMAAGWDADGQPTKNNLEAQISNLRSKLKVIGACCDIKSVRGKGYRIVALS